MLGDRTGAYSAMILGDWGVEAVKVACRGILGVRGVGEVLDLAREAIAV